MRCLFATVGKDAPGVNAAVRAGVRLALRSGMEVYGARRGFLGILNENFHRFKEADVGNVLGKGGSILGSTDFRIRPEDFATLQQLARSLSQFDLVVASGGMGIFSILGKLYDTQDLGLATTMFVPASVENEFLNPARGFFDESGIRAESVGADTAANTAIEAVDRLREQSYLSRTVFLVECVGLKSNYLPIHIGLACGAQRVYLPKFPLLSDEERSEIQQLFGDNFDPNEVDQRELVGWIDRMFKETKKSYLLVVVPNGIPVLTASIQRDKNGNGANTYDRVVTSMAPFELTVLRLVDDLMLHFSGESNVQIRYVVIDDLQLRGVPSLRDRVLGSQYGEASIEEYLAVVNEQNIEKRGNLNLIAIEDATSLRWKCFTREEVLPLYQGTKARAGGLSPLPFFRQMRGTVSGYRPWATL